MGAGPQEEIRNRAELPERRGSTGIETLESRTSESVQAIYSPPGGHFVAYGGDFFFGGRSPPPPSPFFFFPPGVFPQFKFSPFFPPPAPPPWGPPGGTPPAPKFCRPPALP